MYKSTNISLRGTTLRAQCPVAFCCQNEQIWATRVAMDNHRFQHANYILYTYSKGAIVQSPWQTVIHGAKCRGPWMSSWNDRWELSSEPSFVLITPVHMDRSSANLLTMQAIFTVLNSCIFTVTNRLVPVPTRRFTHTAVI